MDLRFGIYVDGTEVDDVPVTPDPARGYAMDDAPYGLIKHFDNLLMEQIRVETELGMFLAHSVSTELLRQRFLGVPEPEITIDNVTYSGILHG